jgi:hypothetical protein
VNGVQSYCQLIPGHTKTTCIDAGFHTESYLAIALVSYSAKQGLQLDGVCIRVMYDSQNHSKIMKCGFEAWFYQAGAKCSMVTTYQGSTPGGIETQTHQLAASTLPLE